MTDGAGPGMNPVVRTCNIAAFIMLLLFYFTGITSAQTIERGPVGIAALERLDLLPYLWGGREVRHASSHEPDGGNDDYTNCLYSYPTPGDSTKTDQVLFDAKEPGCIYRIWMTNQTPADPDPMLEGILKIIVDGVTIFDKDIKNSNSSPSTDTSLFSGNHNYPFISPLVEDWLYSSGGFYCYVPISYKSSCKIIRTVPNNFLTDTSSGKLTHRFYYNIDYISYDSDNGIPGFLNADITRVKAAWESPGVDPKPDPVTTPQYKSTKVVARNGGTLDIVDITGPGCISSIRFRVPYDGLHSEWMNSIIKIYFDDNADRHADLGIKSTISDVKTSYGRFFGGDIYRPFPGDSIEGYENHNGNIRGLLFGTDYNSGWDYNFFPMPFARRAIIEIQNNDIWKTLTLEYEISVKSLPDADHLLKSGQIGYFKSTQTLDKVNCVYGRDYNLMDVTGRGNVVAYVYTPYGGTNGSRQYLEGDERIHIDGSRTPAIYGTGTEDTFNCGWYFTQGRISIAPHGYTVRYASPDGRSTYRLLLGDTIPFNKSVKFGFECGGQNGEASGEWGNISGAYMNSTVYYYASPAASTLTLTDTLDIANTPSETSHQYTRAASYVYGPYDRNLTFEGDDVTLRREVGYHFKSGYSQFTMTILPDNYGVKLRRWMYYNVSNQEALVSVWDSSTNSWKPVGTWYDAGRNPYIGWRESDFNIPAKYTQGKTSIKVKIESVGEWTEYKYEAYTFVSPSKGPLAPVVSLDGVNTLSTTSLHFSWTKPNEPVWGINSYSYCIGTTSGGNDTRGWTDIGPETSFTASGLSLQEGKTYYVSVKAKNGAGVWGDVGKSGGITVLTGKSISDIKKQQDNSGTVVIRGYTVTGTFDGFFYVQDTNRVSGIKIVSSTQVSEGDIVDVEGTLATVNGERRINAVNVLLH